MVSWLRRFFGRMGRTDEDRLAEETRAWAESIPATVRIADAPSRKKVRVAGMVRRMTIRPVEGFQALDAVLWDGTGELVARWLGRGTIPGMGLGTRMVVEGVIGKEQGALRMVNPSFEFA